MRKVTKWDNQCVTGTSDKNLCSDSQSPSQSTGRVLVVHSWCPLMGFSPSGPRVTNPKRHLSTFCFVCHHSARRLSHRRVLPVCFFPLLDFSKAASRVQRVKLSRPVAPIHRPGAPFPSCRAPDGHPWWSHLLLAGLSEPPEQEGPAALGDTQGTSSKVAEDRDE